MLHYSRCASHSATGQGLYHGGVQTNNDHSPVCTKFKCVLQSLSLSATTIGTTNKQIKVNWAKLSKDEVLDSYTACVESKLSSLTLPDFSCNPGLVVGTLRYPMGRVYLWCPTWGRNFLMGMLSNPVARRILTIDSSLVSTSEGLLTNSHLDALDAVTIL